MAQDKQKSQKLIKLPSIMMMGLIRFYQLIISPWLGTHCRFTPSCSQYSLESYQRFGMIKGTYLSVKRIVKCHPWHQGGEDKVPEEK